MTIDQKQPPINDLTMVMREFETNILPNLHRLPSSVLILYLVQLQVYQGRAIAMQDGDTVKYVTGVMQQVMKEVDLRIPIPNRGPLVVF